jgi:tRNA (cytidine/uridine-2'-O-)-methyltransferase
MPLNIVLFEPEIPSNTGNIARTCMITGSKLHLIKPLGFSVSDKSLKRAGMDYWQFVDITYYLDFEEFISKVDSEKVFIATTKESRYYTDVKYEDGCYIMFGKESAGLPQQIHEKFIDRRIKIPMIDNEQARSLNLANSVNIVMYEALRQLGFPGMK